MSERSKKVDAYVARAAPFARPILERIRDAFHRGGPDIVETMKWGFPHFEDHGIVGSMAAFQKHVRFGFWRGDLLKDPKGLFRRLGKTSMSARRVEVLSDLPATATIVSYVKQAVRLNRTGGAATRRRRATAIEGTAKGKSRNGTDRK